MTKTYAPEDQGTGTVQFLSMSVVWSSLDLTKNSLRGDVERKQVYSGCVQVTRWEGKDLCFSSDDFVLSFTILPIWLFTLEGY